MEIFYLATSTIPSQSANSVHVMNMSHALANTGQAVTLFAKSGGTPSENIYALYGVSDSFRIRTTRPHRLRMLTFAKELLTIIKRIYLGPKPDLLYARNINNLAVALIFSIESVAELHQPPSRAQKFWLRLLSKRKLLKRVVVITEALSQEVAEQCKFLDTNKLYVAADAANEHMAVPGKSLKCAARKVGYIGSIYPGRGIDLILDLAGRLPSLEFHIIGGPNPLAEKLRKETTHLKNLCIYGYIDPSSTAEKRMEMDILIAPYQEKVGILGGGDTSKWMSPLKIFEYMASKKAIVCSDIPVLREVLTTNVNSILVPPSDVEAWESAILRLVKDDKVRIALAAKAYEDFEKKYTWDIRAKNVLSFIDGKLQ